MSETVLSLYRGEIQRKPTAREIIANVARCYDLTPDDLTGQNRTRRIAHPRHHAMWEVRQRTTLSFPQIGRIFGDRDHTSVMHGVREHEKRRAAQQVAA